MVDGPHDWCTECLKGIRRAILAGRDLHSKTQGNILFRVPCRIEYPSPCSHGDITQSARLGVKAVAESLPGTNRHLAVHADDRYVELDAVATGQLVADGEVENADVIDRGMRVGLFLNASETTVRVLIAVGERTGGPYTSPFAPITGAVCLARIQP